MYKLKFQNHFQKQYHFKKEKKKISQYLIKRIFHIFQFYKNSNPILFELKAQSMNSRFLSTLKPISKHDYMSLHQLQKWNRQLDLEKDKTIYDKEEIKKQKKIAKQNNVSIFTEIKKIQQEATYLAKCLEQEKTKHEQLQILVKKSEQQIYQQKLQKYQDVLNKKQPDEYEQQKKILHDTEKKLQKLLEKLNSSSFQISKKIDTIRSLRSQRTVHSQLFDKLEREHFDVQFYYKQLLIQRTLKQKNLQEIVENFNKIYQRSSVEFSKLQNKIELSQSSTQRNRGSIFVEEENDLPKVEEAQSLRIPQININRKNSKSKIKKQTSYNVSQATLDQVSTQQLQKFAYKKNVLTILRQLHYENLSQMNEQDINEKLQQTEKLYQQSDNLYEEVSKLQSSIKQMEEQIKQKKSIRQHVYNPKTANLKAEVEQFDIQAKQTKEEVIEFKQQFQKLLKILVTHLPQESQPSLSSFNLKEKSNSNTDLTFIQNQQLLKDMMSTFNDELLDKVLHPYSLQDYASCPSRVLRKNINKYKNNKRVSLCDSRTISHDKKPILSIKVQSPVAQDKNKEVLNQSEHFLQQILNNANNTKFTEKNDKNLLSIMTQEQLIEESKRIIKHSRKKSEFGQTYRTIINKK